MMRQLTGQEMQRLGVESFRAAKKHPIVILLHNIRSMWNVGSIFRTCDAALIEKLVITGYTATPPRTQIDKVALGATETVNWEYISDPLNAIQMLKSNGYQICGLEITDCSKPHYDSSNYIFPTCLILGNEVTGIDNEVLNACDLSVEIPQFGTKHSLNVAVSAGIAVFELVKIYRQSVLSKTDRN